MKPIIAWFANNHVAANLLMGLIILAGFVSLPTMPMKPFPDIDVPLISITVPYLGAAPEEVEEGVCMRIEENLEGIEGVKHIRSNASEGICSVSVELFEDAEEELRRSLSLEPDNAKAHVLLGNIAGLTGRTADAEFHFKEAAAQDPNLFEPFVNLAILSLKGGDKDEARKLYQKYLQKGGPARPALEDRLRE